MTFTNGKFFTSADRAQLDPDPFCQTLPMQPLFWSNTWAQMAMHCPRHFYYGVIRGMAEATGVHLTFGSLIHEGADVYTKAVGAGADTELATEFALQYVLLKSWPERPCPNCGGLSHDCRQCEGKGTIPSPQDVFGGRYGEVWQCSDRTRTNSKKGIVRCPWSKAEHLISAVPGIFLEHGGCYQCPNCKRMEDSRIAYLCSEKTKNRRTLARTIVALCDRMTAGSIKPRVLPDGRIGSEYRWFQPLDIPSPDGLFRLDGSTHDGTKRRPYHMTGSFDGVASAPAVVTVIPEYKTTQREPDAKFWAGYEMSPQVHTYSWAGAKEFGSGTRVMLFAIHVGTGFTEIYPKTVYFSPAALAEWEQELAQKIQEFEIRAGLAREVEARGDDPATAYPRNLAGCNSLPGASTTPCPFRDFCRLDPGDREGFLSNNFEVAHYNPLGAKGTGLVEEGNE